MDLKVLGLLAVRERGTPIVPAAAPARQLLALLAAHADHIVPTTVLTQELWPEGAPQHAHEIIETHVRELRELIDDALDVGREEAVGEAVGEAMGEAAGAPVASGPRTSRDVLVSLSGGYRLDTGGGTSDVRMFQRAAGAGYRAMELEDYRIATERLGEALALWTADAYTGVVTGPHLRAHVARLEQARLRALDLWVEAQHRLGHRHELYTGLSVFLSRFRSAPPGYESLVAELEQGPERGPVGRTYGSPLGRTYATATGRPYAQAPTARTGSVMHSLRHSFPTRHRAPVAG